MIKNKNSNSIKYIYLFLFLGIGFFLNAFYVFSNYWQHMIFIYFLIYFLTYRYITNDYFNSAWVVNAVSFFTIVSRPDALFTDAHSVYYPQILSKLDYGNIKNFWLSEIPSPYPVFSLVTSNTINFFGIESINLLLFLVNAFFIISIFLFFNINRKKFNPYIPFCFVVVLTVLFGIDSSPPDWIFSNNIFKVTIAKLLGVSNMFLDGVSSYTEFSSRRAFIPASLDILMIFPLCLMINKKFKEAIILGLLISIFHYFSFILLFLYFCSYVVTKAQEKFSFFSENYLLFISIVFLLISLSIGILNKFYISESIDSALNILIFERINNEWNLLPIISIGTSIASLFSDNPTFLSFNVSTFDVSLQKLDPTFASPTLGSFRDYSIFPLEFLLVSIFGVYASKRKQMPLLSNTIVIALFSTFISWFLQAFLLLGSFAIFHPWRLSGFSTLLSLLAISYLIFDILKEKIFIFFSFSFLALFTLVPLSNNLYNQNPEDINFLSTQLTKHTYISESEIIIPHDKTSWVLNSGGVAAYSTKLFPYDVNFSEEWLFRYKSQQKILSSNNCEELYFYIRDVKAEINLIVSTEKDIVSSLQNKCDIEIIIFEE